MGWLNDLFTCNDASDRVVMTDTCADELTKLPKEEQAMVKQVLAEENASKDSDENTIEPDKDYEEQVSRGTDSTFEGTGDAEGVCARNQHEYVPKYYKTNGDPAYPVEAVNRAMYATPPNYDSTITAKVKGTSICPNKGKTGGNYKLTNDNEDTTLLTATLSKDGKRGVTFGLNVDKHDKVQNGDNPSVQDSILEIPNTTSPYMGVFPKGKL
jgi:hypothetical protein